ncbi:F-box/kelch-repeat protein At5g60570-like isoform X2 [Phalaenopsis equestris]|uniref:F-box/kelch-repeat protein At5g60570-like isoform X2 n=1 Tax=Phalaenopsis equestris TaxID=78828 RepID=UPI0009E50137|nr:F-box/kelch-repeat protein At5g60570-like isoform X2 [Phalaenopsis equestris]
MNEAQELRTSSILAGFLLFLNHSFENPERKKALITTKSEKMFVIRRYLLQQSFKSLEPENNSFEHHVVYMLLAKNCSLLIEMKIYLLQIYFTMFSLECKKPQKKNLAVRKKPGMGYTRQRSNDCLIPGLPDDVAFQCLALTSRSYYSSLSCLNKRFNFIFGSGYLYELRRQLGIIEHWVYLSCSLMPWEAFDPSQLRWMRLPTMPCDECFSYADKESLAVGTKLLVFGRELTGFAIWMYCLVSRSWCRCPLMTLPRCLFGSGSSGKIAIVAGGSDKNGKILKFAELYDSELGIWETLPDMNLPRKMCSGFFMDDKFYVIGGMSSHTDSLTCGEEFNLQTRTWRRIPDMYPGDNRATHQSPPLVAVVNNQLYTADQSTNEVKKYDKVNNTWHVVKPLPVRADSHNGWGIAFKSCGEMLLVIGGHRGPQGEVIVLHSWCPEERNNGAEWDVLSVRERAGSFVYNCAIMEC